MSKHSLSNILANYPPPWSNSDIHIRPLEGGFSGTKIWQIQCGNSSAALRCWPASYPARRLQNIHRLLSHWRNAGLHFVPQVIRTTGGHLHLEYSSFLWDLCEWILGSPDINPDPDRTRINAAIDALHQIHSQSVPTSIDFDALALRPDSDSMRPCTRAPSPALQRRLSEWQRLDHLTANLPPTSHDLQQLAHRTIELSHRFQFHRHRLQQTAQTLLPMTVCWRDIHRTDLFFDANALTGIVDYGAIGIDTPAIDYGRLLGSWIPSHPALWNDVLSSVAQDTVAVAWLAHQTGSVVAALHWLEWLVLRPRSFADKAAAIRRWTFVVDSLESVPPDSNP